MTPVRTQIRALCRAKRLSEPTGFIKCVLVRVTVKYWSTVTNVTNRTANSTNTNVAVPLDVIISGNRQKHFRLSILFFYQITILNTTAAAQL